MFRPPKRRDTGPLRSGASRARGLLIVARSCLALEAALERTREGFGSVVFVGGEAGIGKSRLIAELAGRAERDGMTVVVGECLPLGDGGLPYAPVVGALRSLVARREGTELEVMLGSVREELAALLPELPSGRSGVPARRRGRDRRRACSSSCWRCLPRPPESDRWYSSWRTFIGPTDRRATSSRS